MVDILPYSEDTKGTKLKRSKYKETEPIKVVESKKSGLTSFSFDQVNNDANELIELRGEGRYFGVTDPEKDKIVEIKSGPVCSNCHKRGHTRVKCKIVICHKCGKVNDHYESQCPSTLICIKCGEKGHYSTECKSKIKKRQYCKRCDSFQHSDENCPSIWRSYIIKRKEEQKSISLPNMSCYNCGSSSHYGDECYAPRNSRIPNLGSAFSGNNLPREFRGVYFDKLRNNESYSDDEEYSPYEAVRDYRRYTGYNNINKPPSRSGIIPSRPKSSKSNYNKFGSNGFGNSNFNNGSGIQRSKSPVYNNLPKKPPAPPPAPPSAPPPPAARNINISKNLPKVPRFQTRDYNNGNNQPSRSGILKRGGTTQFEPTRSGTLNNNKKKNKKMKY
ncbi:unnamed protein product [Candida verbasci]|uniref:CCHC-type domain-containing protein n=1 Tax=Candida verbasci TaxID=1227364 RepID=A0A9W4U1C6_9ASCO|nr:unnamed protein product [Candida verbasci]